MRINSRWKSNLVLVTTTRNKYNLEKEKFIEHRTLLCIHDLVLETNTRNTGVNWKRKSPLNTGHCQAALLTKNDCRWPGCSTT